MKVGILGGSFNPVHNAHLRLGVEALEQVPLDQVDLVPAAQPPHKMGQEILSFDFRCRLLEMAIENCKGLQINRIEGKRSGPSYTIHTLKEYKKSQPQDELYFIIGFDEFLYLPKWYEWRSLPSLTNFVVGGRYGHDVEHLEAFLSNYWPQALQDKDRNTSWKLPEGGLIIYTEIPRLDISSTLIRDKWIQGKSMAYLIPDKVEKCLRDHGIKDFVKGNEPC